MACWASTQICDHPQRCVIAHYLADLESNLDREIAWDETGLAEHVHLGGGYFRRGDKTLARE